MNPIEKILAKKAEDRTLAEVKYLELHLSELSPEQLEQLESEKSEVVVLENAEKKEVETTIETKDIGEGEIETVIASGSLDRHGERISIAGMSTTKYMKNPVVQWAHDYSLPPIGKATKVWKDGNKLMGRMKFAVDENPFAKTIYDLVKGGFLNAVSIGFIPQEMEGNIFTKSEMIEFSVVPVPANSEALISARKLGIDTSIFESDNSYMYKLKDILAKKIEDLTIGEIKFLREHINDLTKSQVTLYASVLKDEEGNSDAGDTGAEGEDEDTEDEDTEDEETEEEDKKDELVEEVKKLKKQVSALKKGNTDTVIVKNININRSASGSNSDVSKEIKFLTYVQCLKTGNFAKYAKMIQKDAMNSGDDSVLLPPQEFVTEIIRLEEEYGVASRFATVRRSNNGSGIKYLLGDDDVEIFDTAEGGFKKSTKLSYDSQTLLWRKFAAILPITDELSEDSAIDLWNDATQRFARAYARRADELVFTSEATGGNTKDGIINVSGTNAVEVDSLEDISYDDFVDMILGVPSVSGNNGRFFLNRTALGIAMKLKDNEDRPLWLPAISSGAPATILGRPYTETEVLPKLEEVGAGDPFIVYGDLRYATLGERTQVDVKMFDSGIVGDPDEVDQEANTINLLTQDAQAMRVVKRMNAVVRFPEAFSVMKLASGS